MGDWTVTGIKERDVPGDSDRIRALEKSLKVAELACLDGGNKVRDLEAQVERLRGALVTCDLMANARHIASEAERFDLLKHIANTATAALEKP